MKEVKKIVTNLNGSSWSVCWSPDGTLIAECGQDRKIRVCRELDGLYNFSASTVSDTTHTRTIRRVAWHPDSLHLAAVSFDSTCSLWRVGVDEKLTLVTKLSGPESEVKGVSFSQCGDMLAVCSRDKSVWIFDVSELIARGRSSTIIPEVSEVEADPEDGEFEFPTSPSQKSLADSTHSFTGNEVECLAVLQGHSQDVKSVKFSPHDPHMLVSVSYDDTIKIWKSATNYDWELSETLRGHSGTVWDIAFHPETPNEFITVSADGSMKIWSNRTYLSAPVRNSYLLAGPLGVSSRNNNQLFIPSGGSGGWSSQTVQITSSLMEGVPTAPVYCVDVTAGGLIAVGCGDNTVRVYMRTGGCTVPVWTEKTDAEPNSVSFRPHSAESDTLAVSFDDGSVRIYSIGDACAVDVGR